MPRCSIEFRRKLRLEVSRRMLEFSSSPRHVDQHCVQPLRAQYQQPKHEHEQDFHAKTHDSLPGEALVIGNNGCCADRLFLVSFDG